MNDVPSNRVLRKKSHSLTHTYSHLMLLFLTSFPSTSRRTDTYLSLFPSFSFAIFPPPAPDDDDADDDDDAGERWERKKRESISRGGKENEIEGRGALSRRSSLHPPHPIVTVSQR